MSALFRILKVLLKAILHLSKSILNIFILSSQKLVYIHVHVVMFDRKAFYVIHC